MLDDMGADKVVKGLVRAFDGLKVSHQIYRQHGPGALKLCIAVFYVISQIPLMNIVRAVTWSHIEAIWQIKCVVRRSTKFDATPQAVFMRKGHTVYFFTVQH
ncbi:hypothetical protein D3C76_1208940 [compost metagenome]